MIGQKGAAFDKYGLNMDMFFQKKRRQPFMLKRCLERLNHIKISFLKTTAVQP